jgi:hypothetical protein
MSGVVTHRQTKELARLTDRYSGMESTLYIA